MDSDKAPIPEYAISHGYVVERVTGCTCGAGASAYGHESHCGWEPVMLVSELHERLTTAPATRDEVAAELDRIADQYTSDSGTAMWVVEGLRERAAELRAERPS